MPKFGYFNKPHRLNNPASFIQKWAWETPHRKAVIIARNDGMASLSFRELNHLSNDFSVKLKTIGVEKGSKVYVASRMSLRLIITYVALLRIGAKTYISNVSKQEDDYDFYIFGENRTVDSIKSFSIHHEHPECLIKDLQTWPESPIEELAWNEEILFYQNAENGFFYKTARQVCASANHMRGKSFAAEAQYYCPFFQLSMDLILSGKTVVTGVKDLKLLERKQIDVDYYFLPLENFSYLPELASKQNVYIYISEGLKPKVRETLNQEQVAANIIFIFGLPEKEIIATQKLNLESEQDLRCLGELDASVTCRQDGEYIAIASETLPNGQTNIGASGEFIKDEFGVNWFVLDKKIRLKNNQLYF
jgi:hypothetical protein